MNTGVSPEIIKLGLFSGSASTVLEKQGYTLGRVIGEGSYCKVRIAETRQHGQVQRYAVKIISRKKASKDFVSRFLPREIEIVRDLQHPNIIQVHRILDTGDTVFIFMDIAERGDLLDYIRTHGALNEPKARNFFRQLVSAIKYLHTKEITHRDLKCENVLLCTEDHIKLTDFGFARKCVDQETGKRILSSTYCGSAAYAAPEILSGTPYNPKMYDVWSLGCILFIMLTGSMPFDDSNIRKMLKYQQERRYTYPSKVVDILSPESKALIRHILEPDITRRATVDQILKNPWLNQPDPDAGSSGASTA
uniref:Protein kinase domain-containing protein n=1 Tax=Strigamia maritima TaxID=126957 RepID=T1JBJ8_STRMM